MLHMDSNLQGETAEEDREVHEAGNQPEELMKWFGRDWTADASLRVVSRAASGTENFVDVSCFSRAFHLVDSMLHCFVMKHRVNSPDGRPQSCGTRPVMRIHGF